ncbi:putative leucine-rich repeat-containing protein DDB_G0290503 isoform X2 [Palaemon carinicauda]|uniref:putative leucine-rich repeat-containing protein DDB_G0290503 isoform X2 n=1 Tax=Palaemon carinicauda TaxID=392227 RepID=UPI0035B681A1
MAKMTSTIFGALLALLISNICFHFTEALVIQCTAVGKFSVPESCQEYFECTSHWGRLYATREVCPAGTMFDDSRNECIPSSSLTSPLRCVQEATPLEVTVVADVSNLEGLTVCDLLNGVDSYATLVSTSAALRESLAHQTLYNRHVAQYNRDLEKARNNTSPWRFGDSLLSGLRNTYQRANEFGGEFQKKLDINKKQIEALSTRELNPKHLDRLQKDIQSLQRDIKNARDALQLTDAAGVQQYFQGVIDSKTKEIEVKQQQINSYSKEGLILNELINFLGFVRDDSDGVEELAMQWGLQFPALLENIGSDADSYDRFAVRIGEDIKILSKEAANLEEGLAGYAGDEERLDAERATLNRRLNALNARNSEINGLIANLIDVMGNKTDMFHSLQSTLCGIGGKIASMINENSTDTDVLNACKYIMQQQNVDTDTSEEQNQINALRQESENNRKRMQRILNKLGSITEELKRMYGSLYPQKERLDQIRVEIENLQTPAKDLENLKKGAVFALSVLVKLEEEVQNLQDTFGSISDQVQGLIGQANAAVSGDDKHQQTIAIKQAIDNLQVTLGSLNLPNIENC